MFSSSLIMHLHTCHATPVCTPDAAASGTQAHHECNHEQLKVAAGVLPPVEILICQSPIKVVPFLLPPPRLLHDCPQAHAHTLCGVCQVHGLFFLGFFVLVTVVAWHIALSTTQAVALLPWRHGSLQASISGQLTQTRHLPPTHTLFVLPFCCSALAVTLTGTRRIRVRVTKTLGQHCLPGATDSLARIILSI